MLTPCHSTTQTKSTAGADDPVLTRYWQRLDQLTEKEWTDFYFMVRQALLRCPASELSALPASRDSYIVEFFTEKMVFKAQRMNTQGVQGISGGSLCFFFRNYLKDELRDGARFTALDDEPEIASDDGTKSDAAVKEFLDRLGGHTRLAEKIQAFIAEQEEWAIRMLGGHFCADDDQAIPMSALCKDISSYHYKAQKLGITVKKDADSLLGYEHTRIGQWMQSLRVTIEPDNMSVMHFLLDALCLEALEIFHGGKS
jgi:hypothetical protein